MTLFLTLLYLLVIPYIGLMMVVYVGMFRAKRRPYSAETPSVTVVIPAHNEEAKLGATLASLSQQQYGGKLEFVIVNDRSSDRTAEIIESFVPKDARFRLVNVLVPSKRLAPKVNAVNTGIAASSGEIIVASDADCEYPVGWVAGMVSHFEPDVAMVVGYVESTRYGEGTAVQRFESADWLSLMLTSRSLTHFGLKFASSANNQAYRRSAFEAVGGFGASGRAPSGDEDLLTQRMGRLKTMRVVFASTPETRVLTKPMADLGALLNQRRRWVSRYRHIMHYHPTFWLGIMTLGFQSVLLSLAILLTAFFPTLVLPVFALWGVKLTVEISGMFVGTGIMNRRDLWGATTVVWALAHPFFIATVALWALWRSGEWRAGAQSYRRKFFRRQWREWRRRVWQSLL